MESIYEIAQLKSGALNNINLPSVLIMKKTDLVFCSQNYFVQQIYVIYIRTTLTL